MNYNEEKYKELNCAGDLSGDNRVIAKSCSINLAPKEQDLV